MSAAELAPAAGLRPSTAARWGLPLFGSEVAMLLRRRRNQLILLALIAIPILIGVAVRLTTDKATGGLIGDITDNGIFVAFTALVVVIPIFLPVAVSVVVGESVAGEANLGTLRYLLVVPVGRTRLLITKLAAIAVWCLVIVSVVAVAGVLTGLALFPAGRVTLLSGTQISLWAALGRLLVVTGYAALMMLGLSAVGLFISTLTEVPIAAMAATLTFAVTMQVLIAVPQLHALRPFLLSNSYLAFADLLRDPIGWSAVGHGVLVTVAYLVIFGSLAWARFTTKDVSS